MPFIQLKTNVTMKEDVREEVKAGFGQVISDIPGKSETWLMVEIEDEKNMYFQGSDEPTAMVEVSAFGQTTEDALEKLTAHLTELVEEKTGVAASRIYVKYDFTKHWGWNGNNF